MSILREVQADLHTAEAQILAMQPGSKVPQPTGETVKVAWMDLPGSEIYALGRTSSTRMRRYFADLKGGAMPFTQKNSLVVNGLHWQIVSVAEYPPEAAGVRAEAEVVA